MTTTPQDDSPYASPQSEETAGDWLKPTLVWRDEDFVVLQESGELPAHCVVCGTLEYERFRFRLAYLREPRRIGWLLELLIFLALFPLSGIVGFLIWNFAKRIYPAFVPIPEAVGVTILIVLGALGTLHEMYFKRKVLFKICYWHCREHEYRSRTDVIRIRVAFLAVLTLVLWAVFGVWSGLLVNYWSKMAVVLSFHGSLLYGVRVLTQKKIQIEIARNENRVVWLSGFGKPFVDSLPPYPHAAERSSPAMAPSSQPL